MNSMIKELDDSYYQELYALEEEIFSYHHQERPTSFPSIPFSQQIYQNLVQQENYLILGYFDDEQLVGVVYVHRRDEHIYYIDDIVVTNEYRNKGIGSALLQYVEELAVKENIDSIELDVWSFNSKAIQFYEKNHFTPKTIRYEKKMK